MENDWRIGGGDYAQFKYAEELGRRGYHVVAYVKHMHTYMQSCTVDSKIKLLYRGSLSPGMRGAGRINAMWGKIYSKIIIESSILSDKNNESILLGYSRKSALLADSISQSTAIPCAHIVFETPGWMSRDLGKMHDDVYVGSLKREWEKTLEVYRRAKWLLPNSELTRREVEDWTGRSVEPAVYAGFDDLGPPCTDPAEGRHILYIGRLDVTKNVHDLIDAVALMSNPPPLIIAGRGHDEDELKDRARQKGVNATFAGHISDAEKWRLIRECYFLVFPTSFEGFGMPPGEALSCGKPVICSDIPILREIYADYVEYFPLHDIKRLADTMEALLANRSYRKERGMAGRAYVLARYTWSHCVDRIEAALSLA